MPKCTANDETPRNCNCCNEPECEVYPLNADGLCIDCASEVGFRPSADEGMAYDSERYLNSGWQEEQYSARYEDRYGPGYDPYED